MFHAINKKRSGENKFRSKFTPNQVHNMMRDLLSAVSTMHHNGIIHRDLKFENIKFLKKGVYDNIKIYDFGSACLHPPGSDKKHYDLAGSPYFAAPEMLSRKGYNEKVDVWSCGIIFFYLLIGSFPFDAKDDIEIMHKIQSTEITYVGKRFQNINQTTIKLLKAMLTRDPDLRISACEARKHQYFKYD